MSAAKGPSEPTSKPRTEDLGASQRIALGTLLRSAGEVIGKSASLIFFVAIARGLGEERFGDFVFGLSLSTVLLIVAGLGMQELIAREVARDRHRVDELLWNVVALKGLMLIVLLGVIAGIVAVQGYDLTTGLAILIVSAGVGFEYQVSTFSAVFQGFERQQHIATSLVINRISTTAMAIAVLLAGGGLVAVAIVFTLGSFLGLASSYALMRRYVVRPRVEIEPAGWTGLVRRGFPFGVLSILSTTALRSTVPLLGLLTVDSLEVGSYGASFRLIEAAMFLAWSFGNAALPWFSRESSGGGISPARGLEISLKTVIALMLPVGLSLSLFAEPLIETLYGTEFAGAVTPLRILGPMAVLWGISAVITAVLVGRNRPGAYTAPALAAIAVLLAGGVALMPSDGAVGAAVAAVAAAAVLTVLSVGTKIGRAHV